MDKKYQTGELTKEQVEMIHEALEERMEDYAADGMEEESAMCAELVEMFGAPDENLIALDADE